MDRRAVALFVGLDLVTFIIVYWLAVPAFGPVLDALDQTTVAATGHVLTAVRLAFIGAIVTRSIRTRRGFDERGDVVPTVAVAAVLAWALQCLVTIVAGLALGTPAVSWALLVALVEWVGFGLLGALFVAPGDADLVPLRYRTEAGRERGSVSLFLVPATAALLFVALAIVLVIGSATNDRRESTTAADAAALAGAQRWADPLGALYDAHASGTTHAEFWALAGTSLSGVTPGAAMRAEAARYADKNGADLVAFSVDLTSAQVSVTVRNRDTVPQSGRQIESSATAELRLRGGLCRSGSALGWLLGGSCRTVPEPEPTPPPEPEPTPAPTLGPDETPAPAPTPTPTPAPDPFTPPGVAAFRADIVLVG